METINMNAVKIDNTNGVNAVNASTTDTEIKAEAKDTSKDTLELTEQNAQENAVKHVLTYVGQSEYKDSTGKKWRKNDENTYGDTEYANRKDLQFMVSYGEMKHTVVTM